MVREVKNVIINDFHEFVEVVVYKENFIVSKNELVDKLYKEQEKERALDRGEVIENKKGRKFAYNEFGELVALDDGTIEDLQRSIFQSTRRSIDTFIGYTLCNKWNAFLTLTFSQTILNEKCLDRYNDDDVKYLWSLFRKKLQYLKPNVKLMCVPEPHKDGALHFHVLVGNFDFTPYMRLLPIRTKKGYPIFSIDKLWSYGFSTISLINTSDSQQACSFYLQKYMKKDFNCNYNKKRYFATHNLEFKEKFVGLITPEKLEEILRANEHEFYKETDKMIVYKIKKCYNE